MVDEQATLRNIEGTHQIGSTISIDDFGIGYSNLSYLKRFPIHSLKIDQSFIKNICIDTGDSNIVNAMIGLAKNLNLAIVAEGVETKEQLNTLQSSGCSNIQGFLYSQPLSADQFERFLHTNRSALLHKH
jgi:EAL domain-containing protein (putative c-di-GMP-specific phosphodiesterase class I)